MAPSRRERGLAFDAFARLLLDVAGYLPTKVRLSVTTAGALLDLRAREKAAGIPLLGEGRALAREVSAEEVRRFYRRFRRERRSVKRLVAWALAPGGFSRAALTWLDRLTDPARPDFRLFGPERILHLLARAGCVCDPLDLDSLVRAHCTLPLGPRALLFYQGRFHWLQTVLLNRRPALFFLLTPEGEPLPRRLAEEVRRLEPSLRDKKVYDLHLRERILLRLLSLQPLDAEGLAAPLREPVPDVLMVLTLLHREGLLSCHQVPRRPRKQDRYALVPKFPVFLDLARQFLGGPHRFTFLASPFASQQIREGLLGHLQMRFSGRLPDQDLPEAVRLASASPAALAYALFEDPAPGAPPPTGTALIADLARRFLRDTEEPALEAVLAARGIRSILTRSVVKAAAVQEPYFAAAAESIRTLPKPAAGSASRATPLPPEVETALELGAATMHMAEYDHAVAYLDRAIKELKDPAWLKTAWNNKGLCCNNKRRHTEAIDCFNEALRHDPGLKQAWFNKAVCLREIGDSTGAIRCAKRALEIDPHYKEARDLLQRFQPVQAPPTPPARP
ncbi:MAG: tetratricopeptide repeat protein [candidate division NC10 bacterium]|nr:tetratricopeptide repeat protein [candidate division NC10 bacterium]